MSEPIMNDLSAAPQAADPHSTTLMRATPPEPAETLVMGLGGAGAYVCRRLSERIQGSFGLGAPVGTPTFLTVDTDRGATAPLAERAVLLTANAAILDAAYRAPERFRAEWIDREVLRGRGSLEQGTGGYRMLGRFLLLLPENQAALRDRVMKWLQSGRKDAPRQVYLVAGAGGGTGSGTFIDTAYLIRSVAQQMGVTVDVRGILFVPPAGDLPRVPNSFAALSELHYFSDPCTLYRAHLGEGDEPFVTRQAPFNRVSLLTSITAEGVTIPLYELQERAVIYLLTATVGDNGHWAGQRHNLEAGIRPVDPDGNPQNFTSFGTEWVEYPEERLVSAVYRNLVRRSLVPWLSGDDMLRLADLRGNVPLRESEPMSALLMDTGDLRQENGAVETIMRPLRTRRPWIHKAPPHQWKSIDTEVEGLVREAVGVPPTGAASGKGPVADRSRRVREQVIGELREQSAKWLSAENVSLERIGRVLNEAAAELRTATDPAAEWEAAQRMCAAARRRTLGAVERVRKDAFLIPWRGLAMKKLAAEYERIAFSYVVQSLRAESIPFMRELRGQILEPIRAWAARVGELHALFATLSRSWADHESGMLERLRKDEEDRRLVLGMLKLPGAETPYVANTGWNLPFCRPEDELQAIKDLRKGWIQFLVEREEGILANPGRSVLDGAGDNQRENRLPWLMPSSLNPTLEAGGSTPRQREVIARVDWELRRQMEDRLRGWLSATAYERMAEQYRNPTDLEFQLQRLITLAAELPALDPPHARPQGFPHEYEVLFFPESKQGDLPAPVRKVMDSGSRDRPTHAVPSRSPHFMTAVTEHPGFSLARCPEFHHLDEAYREMVARAPKGAPTPFSRIDIPWEAATLVTRARYRDASDVLFLALALGLMRTNPDGELPIPTALAPSDHRERRFPLPNEFDRAVRQLAGDAPTLESVARAVDRAVQSKGVEWCALQVERAVHGENPLGIWFPGAQPGSTQEKQGAWAERQKRLASLRAVSRHDDLLEEYGRTVAAQETEWLKWGEAYVCPACNANLGLNAEALPGACGTCRTAIQPQKLAGAANADGFRRIPNPFVTGTPLETRSNVFVGREDIIRTVKERLVRPVSRTILILTGERRCGKTSALRQLQYRLEADLTPIFIDLQGLTATDLPGFVYWLAWRVKEGLEDRGIAMELSSFEEFSKHPADFQFESVILPEIRRALKGGRVLLMLDEFEVLATRVMNGVFDARAFDYLRHLMQHVQGIEFLFAGTHILRKFAANYATFLFNIGVFLDVDFLRKEDAVRLIQEPVAAAGVSYTPEALEKVLELGGAHAYFTQLFGFHLVERLNRLRKRQITHEDVEAEAGPVIAAASAHLDHLWGQLGEADKLLVSYFVETCPRGETRLEEDVLQQAVQHDPTLRPFVFRTAVEKLMEVGLLRGYDVELEGGRQARALGLTAEVYRRWIAVTRPFNRLKEEGLTWH